jgi:hypothetical protein
MVYKVIVLGVVISMTSNKSEARSDYLQSNSHSKQLIELSDNGAPRLIASTDWKKQIYEHA